MLRLIHRYKESIGILFLVVAFCFAISGIGVDILNQSGQTAYAIKVNNKEFSYQELAQTEKRIEGQYRQQFGANFSKLKEIFKLNIAQQAMDTLIDTHLLEAKAEQFGFAVGIEQIRQQIAKELSRSSGQDFQVEMYRSFLRNSGMSAQQFEYEVKRSLLRDNIVDVMEDASQVSLAEAKAEMRRAETVRKVIFAELSPKDLLKEVADPNSDELGRYYESHATDFEVPTRVEYKYFTFEPKDFEAAVEVRPEDIEFYYTENRSRFQNPEQIKARVLKLKLPKDQKKAAEIKEKAKQIREEASTGKPFDLLVNLHSDDENTRSKGGDLGWINHGVLPPAVDKAAFDLKALGLTEPIESDESIQIVKVEEYKTSSDKPLDQVKDQIINEIKTREAPSFAAAKAREIKDLSGLSVRSSVDAPETLTSQVLAAPGADKPGIVVIDQGAATTVVQITSVKPPEVPALDIIKERVVAAWRLEAAAKLAEERSKLALDAKSLKELKGFTIVGPSEVSNQKPAESAELDQAIKRVFKVGAPIKQIFKVSEKFVLAEVVEITPPAKLDDQKALEEYKERSRSISRTTLLESFVGELKKESEIDFDPALLRNRDST